MRVPFGIHMTKLPSGDFEAAVMGGCVEEIGATASEACEELADTLDTLARRLRDFARHVERKESES